jgi:hypothetical protein
MRSGKSVPIPAWGRRDFCYAATCRHPSGIVTINDWSRSLALFEVLSESLKHDCQLRRQDGSAMLNALTAALQG